MVLQTRSRGKGYACNNSGTTRNGVFLLGSCKGVISRTSEARIVSWKGASTQRRFQPLLETDTKKRLVKTLQAGKCLACAVVIFKCGNQRLCYSYLYLRHVNCQ
jgi:hypothetical protein